MRIPPHFALGAYLLALISAAHAQKGSTEASPCAFSIRTYRLLSTELTTGFVSKDKGQLRAPELPPASAGHGEQEAFLKRSHDVLKEFLYLQGVQLPPGSLACYDRACPKEAQA